jgi:transketolase C-terminal domain/subunit
MKKHFSELLLQKMDENKDIYFITADLGYKLWDDINEKYPDRCIIMGASEQLAMGAAVGLALDGKIPVVYSITTFLLYRPFEIIRNYINYENLGVKLVGSGRDRDYSHDGISHWSEDDKEVLSLFENIHVHHPNSNEELETYMDDMLSTSPHVPSYLNLRR